MSIRFERVNKICELIKMRNSLTIRELAEILNVSIMTIRRDLNDILSDPDIQMIRGMFLYNPQCEKEEGTSYSVITASTEFKEAKIRIAEEAVSMIEAEDHILIDAGSTTEFFAKRLPENLKMTVLCFSLNILNIVINKKNTSVLLPGGMYHSSSMLFESREGIELIKNTRVNKAFISASGVNLRLGATCSAEFERELKKTALKSAQTRILLVDSSKFDKLQKRYFADLKNFDVIITDRGLSEEIAADIRSQKIELRRV